MTIRNDDVRDIIEIGAEEGMRRFIPMALVLCCVGLVMVADGDSRHYSRGWIVALLTGGFALFAFIRLANPGRPLMVLSPDGIRYRIPFVKEVMIPWFEVRGVDTIDIKAWVPRVPWRVTYKDVTVFAVSKRFYDENLHVDSIFQRGPGWNVHFIRKGHLMQIALHKEAFRWPPAELRAALSARWQAFRDAPVAIGDTPELVAATAAEPAVAAEPAAPLGHIRRPRVHRRTAPWTAWELIKVGVPLTGILVAFANVVGTWETTAQQARRIAQEKQAAEDRREREQRKKDEEKWRERMRSLGQ